MCRRALVAARRRRPVSRLAAEEAELGLSDLPPSAAAATTVRTLLVCDLVASTPLVQQLGDEAAAEVLARHDRAGREIAQACAGREIDKSDGFLLLFERPIQAVRFALAYQQRVRALGEVGSLSLASRVGIHLGEVVLRENAPEDVRRGAKPLEVEGLAKAIAARVTSIAGGGRILLTRAAFDLARRGAVGAETGGPPLRWVAHGRYRLAGVEAEATSPAPTRSRNAGRRRRSSPSKCSRRTVPIPPRRAWRSATSSRSISARIDSIEPRPWRTVWWVC